MEEKYEGVSGGRNSKRKWGKGITGNEENRFQAPKRKKGVTIGTPRRDWGFKERLCTNQKKSGGR